MQLPLPFFDLPRRRKPKKPSVRSTSPPPPPPQQPPPDRREQRRRILRILGAIVVYASAVFTILGYWGCTRDHLLKISIERDNGDLTDERKWAPELRRS